MSKTLKTRIDALEKSKAGNIRSHFVIFLGDSTKATDCNGRTWTVEELDAIGAKEVILTARDGLQK